MTDIIELLRGKIAAAQMRATTAQKALDDSIVEIKSYRDILNALPRSSTGRGPSVRSLKARRNWTDEEDAALRFAAEQHRSAVNLAAELNRTHTAVRQRACALGLSMETRGAHRRK